MATVNAISHFDDVLLECDNFWYQHHVDGAYNSDEVLNCNNWIGIFPSSHRASPARLFTILSRLDFSTLRRNVTICYRQVFAGPNYSLKYFLLFRWRNFATVNVFRLRSACHFNEIWLYFFTQDGEQPHSRANNHQFCYNFKFQLSTMSAVARLCAQLECLRVIFNSPIWCFVPDSSLVNRAVMVIQRKNWPKYVHFRTNTQNEMYF